MLGVFRYPHVLTKHLIRATNVTAKEIISKECYLTIGCISCYKVAIKYFRHGWDIKRVAYCILYDFITVRWKSSTDQVSIFHRYLNKIFQGLALFPKFKNTRLIVIFTELFVIKYYFVNTIKCKELEFLGSIRLDKAVRYLRIRVKPCVVYLICKVWYGQIELPRSGGSQS